MRDAVEEQKILKRPFRPPLRPLPAKDDTTEPSAKRSGNTRRAATAEGVDRKVDDQHTYPSRGRQSTSQTDRPSASTGLPKPSVAVAAALPAVAHTAPPKAADVVKHCEAGPGSMPREATAVQPTGVQPVGASALPCPSLDTAHNATGGLPGQFDAAIAAVEARLGARIQEQQAVHQAERAEWQVEVAKWQAEVGEWQAERAAFKAQLEDAQATILRLSSFGVQAATECGAAAGAPALAADGPAIVSAPGMESMDVAAARRDCDSHAKQQRDKEQEAQAEAEIDASRVKYPTNKQRRSKAVEDRVLALWHQAIEAAFPGLGIHKFNQDAPFGGTTSPGTEMRTAVKQELFKLMGITLVDHPKVNKWFNNHWVTVIKNATCPKNCHGCQQLQQ